VIYIFCLLTVGSLFSTVNSFMSRSEQSTVLSNVTAVLSLKIAYCQLHNKIIACSNSEEETVFTYNPLTKLQTFLTFRASQNDIINDNLLKFGWIIG
jgi:hypothetical protein